MTAQPGDSVIVRAGTGDAGMRLDRLLAGHLPSLSRTRLKRLIEEGRVSCAGAGLSDPSFKVRPGQHFVLALPEAETAAPAAQKIPLAIRFEDAHLIVIDKPAGMVVHPAPGNLDRTLVNALLAHCGDSLSGIGGVCRPGIVHRLDKDTSGLMVVAKTESAHQALSRDFALRRIERAYAAFVWGVPTPPDGEIAGNIGRSPSNRKKMAVLGEGRGRPALTRYRLLRAYRNEAAFLECRLATGRTHQIRVHLAHSGHPLIGDPVYGARAGRARLRGLHATASRGGGGRAGPPGAVAAAFPRQALHARLLGFDHPAGAGHLVFESPLPEDLRELEYFLERL
ncbi:MAG TPA: RluA family pseudouridine synthase [Stellaceae bacterium]|nr:RluA family pseudouridine synthase [Stellaceae bacterium]